VSILTRIDMKIGLCKLDMYIRYVNWTDASGYEKLLLKLDTL